MSNDLIDIEVWTTTDKDAENYGHELLIPGNVTEDDFEIAEDFFGCERDALKHEPRKVTEAVLNAAAEASELM